MNTLVFTIDAEFLGRRDRWLAQEGWRHYSSWRWYRWDEVERILAQGEGR